MWQRRKKICINSVKARGKKRILPDDKLHQNKNESKISRVVFNFLHENFPVEVRGFSEFLHCLTVLSKVGLKNSERSSGNIFRSI